LKSRRFSLTLLDRSDGNRDRWAESGLAGVFY
jgi:hypothetical protein